MERPGPGASLADVLISGEQFGIGGATSVRGTGERPLAADSGLFSTLEISTAELLLACGRWASRTRLVAATAGRQTPANLTLTS